MNRSFRPSNSNARILVLGGAGHFGGRISRRLVEGAATEVLLAGRRLERAALFAERLSAQHPTARVSAVRLDHTAADFAASLAKLAPTVVVHAAGPFQGQDYRVAEACLACGSHYVDLADGRAFVAGFSGLDEPARQRDLLLVTGASTLPGLSSAVIEHLRGRFATLEGIEIAIVPGNRAPRGESTVAAVLGYCGRPFRWLKDGRWQITHGWQDLVVHRYPALGRRRLGACDVPDLELLPRLEPGLRTVTFRAGLELGWQQWGLWLMAWMVRARLVRDWSSHARTFQRIADRFGSMGTESGGMHVHLWGRDGDSNSVSCTWYLTVRRNHGPEIPCVPASVLARKLAHGEISRRGAQPCVGLFTFDDFAEAVADLDVSWTVV